VIPLKGNTLFFGHAHIGPLITITLMNNVSKREGLLTTWEVKISRSVARNFLEERSDDLFICS